jgi:hypothetical protein
MEKEKKSRCCIKNFGFSWALVALTYNPSYSGGRDQENYGSTTQANSSRDTFLKKTITK